MRYKLIFPIVAIFISVLACSEKKSGVSPEKKVIIYNSVDIAKTNSTKVYAHYMPWYETRATSTNNKWGLHWTMNTKDPEIIDETGKRQIASYFYPSIGPYASGDKDVIEYHLLLMKYAGIDGIIIDWYGIHNVNDYAAIKANTEAIVDMMDETGLKFAIDYEDRTLADVVSQGAALSKIDGAIEDVKYLQSKFFSNVNYIKINNQPLLMIFGPIQLQTEAEWTSVFSALTPKPCFLTLWNESSDAGKNASGEYGWVYKNHTYVDNFYANRIQTLGVAMGSVYPGFKDFYSEGGWGNSIGWTIDHANGATLDDMLTKAKNAQLDYLQLITWNDFGEGTIIEPTLEFGNSYMEKIKSFAGITGYTNVFATIKTQFDLRKKLKANSSAQKSLDQAFYYFVSLQSEKASHVIDSLQIKYQ